MIRTYELSLTTQGPLYPPSEVMNAAGEFVVIGLINRPGPGGAEWGSALVAADSPLPAFGESAPYRVVRELDVSGADRAMVLHTLPLPLPCTNYPAVFAPQQLPEPFAVVRPSYPFHQVPIPDLQPEDGRRLTEPITLGQWARAAGELTVTLVDEDTAADFHARFTGLIPDSLYTVMAIRVRDFATGHVRTHPSPLGVPNALITDDKGDADYLARMPDPFPPADSARAANRITNIVLLWMSDQRTYGGAIGHFGLGGDVHAQLKLRSPSFHEFTTRSLRD